MKKYLGEILIILLILVSGAATVTGSSHLAFALLAAAWHVALLLMLAAVCVFRLTMRAGDERMLRDLDAVSARIRDVETALRLLGTSIAQAHSPIAPPAQGDEALPARPRPKVVRDAARLAEDDEDETDAVSELTAELLGMTPSSVPRQGAPQPGIQRSDPATEPDILAIATRQAQQQTARARFATEEELDEMLPLEPRELPEKRRRSFNE